MSAADVIPIHPMTRRRLMALFVHALWIGAIGAIGVWGLVGKIWQVRRRTRKIPICSVDQLQAAPNGLTIRLNDHHYFLRADEQLVLALSLRCTHSDCAVEYDSQRLQFFCHCHGGVFDRYGRVLAGPPRRPLERVSIRIEGNVIYLLDRS